MNYMKMETSFGGVWEASDKGCLPFRIDGLAYVHEKDGEWWASIDIEHRPERGPFRTMQDAMNFADNTLLFQDPRCKIQDARKQSLELAAPEMYEALLVLGGHLKNPLDYISTHDGFKTLKSYLRDILAKARGES